MRRRESEGLGGQDVKQSRRGGERFNPVRGGHGGLEQQGANNIIGRSNDAFSFTVLRRGVRAGHAKVDAPGEEESTGAGVVKLAPVVALNSLYGGAELGGGVGNEVGERAESVRFNT